MRSLDAAAAGGGLQRIVGKVNYSMLPEKELRRLVRELGLPDRGDRRGLIHLHRPADGWRGGRVEVCEHEERGLAISEATGPAAESRRRRRRNCPRRRLRSGSGADTPHPHTNGRGAG